MLCAKLDAFDKQVRDRNLQSVVVMDVKEIHKSIGDATLGTRLKEFIQLGRDLLELEHTHSRLLDMHKAWNSPMK